VMPTRPADRKLVLEYLRLQSPTLRVFEVTTDNATWLRVQYRVASLAVGDVVWEIPPIGTRPLRLGVLFSGEGRRPPHRAEILDPGAKNQPSSVIHAGEAVADDYDVVLIHTPEGGAVSVVAGV
jgi:hypothetical protein